MRGILKNVPKTKLMANENSLNFVHIIKETCFTKSNTFYEDHRCTSCFKKRRDKTY